MKKRFFESSNNRFSLFRSFFIDKVLEKGVEQLCFFSSSVFFMVK